MHGMARRGGQGFLEILNMASSRQLSMRALTSIFIVHNKLHKLLSIIIDYKYEKGQGIVGQNRKDAHKVPQQVEHILIIGAGMAGLAAAIALGCEGKK